ncbi:MAG TPA: hypothetical protein VM939_14565, partial [Gemmatimonadaceae bacterium]|nr:hypothetical protein [Gemmatimonadaceae bacterium]
MHPRTWSAIAASIAVLAGAALRVPSLHDPVADQAPERMELVLPTLYVVFSPLSRVLDGFGLLSNG